ncbi:MAG TPA: response regulator [Methylomirabilota bacterium]|nr:response regulator [Methylomirabilota bacterium]
MNRDQVNRHGGSMGRARILVIDDERAVRELISDALKIEGHDVHTAENGKEGLDLIGRNRFDLVFCDLRMPEMDGQQLYEEIQRDYPQVLKRIVFVTAQANSADYGPFLRTTGIPVIEKPFTLSQLRQMVGKMVGVVR